jgi:hypothetical protein
MKPRHLVASIVGAVLLYPISFGPVVWISARMHSPASIDRDQFGIELYEPLVDLAAKNPTTCKFLIWYQFVVPPPE